MQASARAGLALATAGVALALAIGLRAERLGGDAATPGLVFVVDVPELALEEIDVATIAEVWRRRLRGATVRTAPAPASTPETVGVRVEVSGERDVEEVRAALVASGRFELRWVREGTAVTAAWSQAVKDRRVDGVPPEVEAHAETWVDERGREHFDAYLTAPTPEALAPAVTALAAAHPLDHDEEIVHEQVWPAAGDRARPYVRTYLVDRLPVLTSTHVGAATVEIDRYTLRPEVHVELTRRGGAIFAELTAAGVGRKLAILVGSEVVSAPVVHGAITGGRMSITMGGGDPADQERQAYALATTLNGGGGRFLAEFAARLVERHAPAPTLVWGLRGGLAAVAGILAWLVAALAARRRWFEPAPATSAGRARWDAAVVPALLTLGPPLLLWYAGGELLAPGVDRDALDELLGPGADRAARAPFGILALGLGPVVGAFLFVELAALLGELLVPSRRGRRLGTRAERRRLDLAAWLLATALAALQAHFIARYLATSGLLDGGPDAHALVVLGLVGGVIVHVVAAELITRRGLVDGYLVLVAAGLLTWLVPMVGPALDGDAPEARTLLPVLAACGLAAVIATRLCSAGGGPRLPYTGVVPVALVQHGLALLALPALWWPWLAIRLAAARSWLVVVELGALVSLTALILWVNPRPGSRHGVAATLAFLALLALLALGLDDAARATGPTLAGVTLGVVGAELWVGLVARARLIAPVTVMTVHDVERADRAAARLTAAGIPHAVLGARARAALRLLAAYAPIAIRVPEDRAAEAAAVLARDGGDAP